MINTKIRPREGVKRELIKSWLLHYRLSLPTVGIIKKEENNMPTGRD